MPTNTQPSKLAATDSGGRVSTSLSVISSKKFGYEQARHLLWRAGFGGTPAQIQLLASWGPEKSVDYLLAPEKVSFEPITENQFDNSIMRPPTAEERALYREAARKQDENTLAQLRLKRQMAEQDDRRQARDMQKWWLKRMIETPRPLEEKMTLFWHGHFATSYRTIQNSYHMFLQNQLFREHALGNFGNLLFRIIRDPAMIAYLDNNDSKKGKPNENLAREIMELFALGLGNYTERDIKEGARALTGYTFEGDKFVFRKNDHDGGQKTILGSSGAFDGDDFVRIILEQRACATFIVRKLYSYFVAELPPDERVRFDDLPATSKTVLKELAGTFQGARYEVRPVLRRLFLSEHFYSPAFMNEQIKSPTALLVGAVRSLNAPVRDLAILNDAMDLMGQELFFPPSVKGWQGGRSWINTSTMFVRQNILAFLLTGKKPQGYDASADMQKFDPEALLSELTSTDPAAAKEPRQVAEYLLRLTTGRVDPHAVASLTSFANQHNNQINANTLSGMLLLVTAMPEYQLC
jgi:uncharacterized protein (DUF1800 family)